MALKNFTYVLKCINLVMGDNNVEYINHNILNLLDPSTDSSLPFVYNSFSWDYCVSDCFCLGFIKYLWSLHSQVHSEPIYTHSTETNRPYIHA